MGSNMVFVLQHGDSDPQAIPLGKPGGNRLPPPTVGEMAYFTLAMVRSNGQQIHMRHALPVAAFAMNTGEALLVTATRRAIKPEEKEQLRVMRQRLALARPELVAATPDTAEPRALLHGANESGGRHVFDFAF